MFEQFFGRSLEDVLNVKYVCEQCSTPYEHRNEPIGCNTWKRIDGKPDSHRWRWISLTQQPGRTPSPDWAKGNKLCATPKCKIPRCWFLPSTDLSYCLDCYLRNREIHGVTAPRFTGFDNVEPPREETVLFRTRCGATQTKQWFAPVPPTIILPLSVPSRVIRGGLLYPGCASTRTFSYSHRDRVDGELIYEEIP